MVTGTAGAMSQIALTVIGEGPNPHRIKMVLTTGNDHTTMDLGIVGDHEEDTIVDHVIDRVIEDMTMALGIDRAIGDMTMDLLGIDRVIKGMTMDPLGIDRATKALMMDQLVTDHATEDTTMGPPAKDRDIEDTTMGRHVIDRVSGRVGTTGMMMVHEEMIGMEIEEKDLAVDGIMVIETGMRTVHITSANLSKTKPKKLRRFSTPSRKLQNSIDAVVKHGAYYCYCAYVLHISRYSCFLWVVPTNTGTFLRDLKLCRENRI